MNFNNISFSSIDIEAQLFHGIGNIKEKHDSKELKVLLNKKIQEIVHRDEEDAEEATGLMITPVLYTKENTALVPEAELFMNRLMDKARRSTSYMMLKHVEHWISVAVYMGWTGIPQLELRGDREKDPVGRFYGRFRRWMQEQRIPKEHRLKVLRDLFPIYGAPWDDFTSIEQWEEFAEMHGIKGMQAKTVARESSLLHASFYQAFCKWTAQFEDKKKLRKRIFPLVRLQKKSVESQEQHMKPWKGFITIEAWRNFLVDSPWSTYSIAEMYDDPASRSFYVAFLRWTRDQENTTQLRRELFPNANALRTYATGDGSRQRIRSIYEIEYTPYASWKNFTRLSDWQTYISSRGWEGLSQQELCALPEEGGHAFVGAFTQWVRTKPPKEREELLRSIFPIDQVRWGQLDTIEQWIEIAKILGLYMRTPTEVKAVNESFYGGFHRWSQQHGGKRIRKQMYTYQGQSRVGRIHRKRRDV